MAVDSVGAVFAGATAEASLAAVDSLVVMVVVSSAIRVVAEIQKEFPKLEGELGKHTSKVVQVPCNHNLSADAG